MRFTCYGDECLKCPLKDCIRDLTAVGERVIRVWLERGNVVGKTIRTWLERGNYEP